MKVALLTPSKSAHSETFIANHIKHLPFEIVVVYGGSFPNAVDGFEISKFNFIIYKWANKMKKFLGLETTSLAAFRLKKILNNYKIEHVFCEYLTTGAEVVDVIKSANISMSAIALGYDISVYDILDSYKTKYKALFDYAQSLFVVSNHMKTQMISMGCLERKIIWTPAGPDIVFFELYPKMTSQQFFALGRFVDKKAPHLTILAFIKVLKEFPEATLIMGGDGDFWHFCNDLIKNLSVENSIKLIGRTTLDQQKKLLEASFGFIQHSRIAIDGNSEGTPVAILEANASALPVISTLHAGIPEVVQDGVTGMLVKENDVEAMAAAILYLLRNPEKARKMGAEGRTFITNNFTLEKHINILAKGMQHDAV